MENINNQNETSEENKEEITIKIKTFNKEFEVKIKKTETVQKLKQLIEEVGNFFLFLKSILKKYFKNIYQFLINIDT